MRHLFIFIACSSLLSGCSDFDRPFELKDLRILAIQTEPSELLYSPLFLFPDEILPPAIQKPTQEIKVTIYAYDPRGNEVETRLQLCPAPLIDEQDGCLDYDYYEKKGEHPFPEVTRPITGTVKTSDSGAGHLEGFEYTFVLSPKDFDLFLPKDELGNLIPSVFPTYLIFDVVVTPKNGPDIESERAFKRLPMYFDFANPITPPQLGQEVAAALGTRFCNLSDNIEAFEAGSEADCVYSKLPNQNPDLLGFDVSLSPISPKELVTATSINEVGFPLNAKIDVKPGDKLLISPVVTADTVERYQIFSFDLNSGEISPVNQEESLHVEYVVTGGGFFDGPPFGSMQSTNGHISVIWTLPTDRDKDDIDGLVAVIRDQRGGTTVSEITVRYVEAGKKDDNAFGF